MYYLPIAILAYFLNSIAVTVDKFLLNKAIPDPIIYIFYFSIISLLLTIIMPFVSAPPFFVIIIASLSTLSWTFGTYLMFKVLKFGQIQRVIPIIGTLTALFLLIIASQTKTITSYQAFAIVTLVIGLIFLTLEDWKGHIGKMEIILQVGSAIFFAISYFLLRLSFEGQNFLSVLVWSKPILIPLGVFLLIIPSTRNKILPFLKPKANIVSTNSKLFVFGQVSAAISEFLLVFSISLASPAIINSLQGVKYIFLLIAGLVLGKRLPNVFKVNLSFKFLITQILGIIFIAIGLYILSLNI